MAEQIKIKRLIGQATNYDPEEMSEEFCTYFLNARHINGKTEKVFGVGSTYDSAVGFGYAPRNIVAYHHDELTNDYVLIAVGINTGSSNQLELKYWTGSAWSDIDNLLENSLPTVNHADAINPIIQINEVIRFLPGRHTSGTPEGIWIGYIDRDFFDGNYLASSYGAGFYAYSIKIDPPDISSSGLNIQVEQIRDGEFSADENENELSESHVEAYSDVINGTEVDTYFYKFSYLYDGNQESQLSDELRVDYDFTNKVFGKFTFNITVANHNKRITGMKVYRSSSANGTYYNIMTIDFIRKSDDALGETADCYSGNSYAYIPGMTDFDFDNGKAYKIYVKVDRIYRSSGDWYHLPYWLQIYDTAVQGALDGTGNEVIDSVQTLSASQRWWTFWNCGYKISNITDGTVDRREEQGAYGGPGVLILGDDYDGVTLAGGVINLDMDTLSDGWPITGTSTYGDDGEMTKCTHSIQHIPFRYVGDKIRLSGFDDPADLNNTYRNYDIGDSTTYWLKVWSDFSGGSDTGIWDHGEDYVIEKQYGKAICLKLRETLLAADQRWSDLADESGGYPVNSYTGINGGSSACDWKIAAPIKGMYFCSLDTGVIYYTFYDNIISNGSEHPYQNAVSLDINAKYAIMLKNRLWLADIILDPSNKAEIHRDWIAYSELDKPDILNVSNVILLPDIKGGEVTGLTTSFGSLIPIKKNAYFRIDVPDPADDTTFSILESAVKKGNIAADGCIQIGHAFYPIAFDGIYEADLNIIAASNDTPMLNARISEPINDAFLDFSTAYKQAVITGYDQVNNELYFKTSQVYVFNLDTKSWRREITGTTYALFGYDQNGDLLTYSAGDDKFLPINGDSLTQFEIKSKHFRISHVRDEIIRYLRIVYTATATIKIYMYVDPLFNSAVLADTLPVTAAGEVGTYKVVLNTRAKAFMFRIYEEAASTNDFKLYDIEIEAEIS